VETFTEDFSILSSRVTSLNDVFEFHDRGLSGKISLVLSTLLSLVEVVRLNRGQKVWFHADGSYQAVKDQFQGNLDGLHAAVKLWRTT